MIKRGYLNDQGGAMTWRGPRSGGSHRGYHTKGWAKIREYWRGQRLPCSRCGCAIDYDGPYMIMVRGKRTVNPRYLVVGHITSVATATALGWPDTQTYALGNTRPECWTCSNRSGARSGNRIRRSTPLPPSLVIMDVARANKGAPKESLTPTSSQVHTSRW